MLHVSAAGATHKIDMFPNRCPQCHHAIEPVLVEGVVPQHDSMGPSTLELCFQCPQRNCHRLFIGRYSGEWEVGSYDHAYRLYSTTTYTPPPPTHEPEVAAISPQFQEVFKEAAAAEAWNLKGIAGCGYRKALEFLIKDYAVTLNPDRSDDIRAAFLGKVIEEFVPDAGVKACAKRAAWLGNDETHYVRRWSDHDRDDLKKLLALTESWITTAERTKAYLDGMPE